MTRILILDDDKLIRWSLDKILARDGYVIDTAATTAEALALADRAEYALVLTDLEICGDRADKFFADLIVRQPRTRVVVLSALATDEAERALGRVPTYAVLEKPFTSDAILAVVHAALDPANRPPKSSIQGE